MFTSLHWTLPIGILLAGWTGAGSSQTPEAREHAVTQTTTTGEDEASQEQSQPVESPFASYRGMMLHYAKGSAAEGGGEFEAARRAFEDGLQLVPSSPHMLLGLARNAASMGDHDAALDALERYAAIGAHANPETIGAFDHLRDDERYEQIAAQIEAIDADAPGVRAFVTLRPADLWNEGIACDLATGDLFAGSVKHGKIVRVRDGVQEDFGTSAEDGLMEVLGLDVDEQRRELWACTGRDQGTPGGKHDFGETPRANEIVVYSLESGKLLRRYAIAPSEPIRMWNDISVAPDGTAYFTDMSAAEVHRISPGGEPELQLAVENWNYPNGIATAEDGTLLYVACLEGVLVVDLASGATSPLSPGRQLHTGLGDGMAVRGRELFVVQNNRMLGYRVLHCRLDETGREVAWSEVLRFSRHMSLMPYTCAVGEDVLYVNLTLPFDRFGTTDESMWGWNSLILPLSYSR